MSAVPWPKSGWLLPWVLMYLCELPLILFAWGFNDWAGGAVGWLMPLALYLAVGSVTTGLVLGVARLVGRVETGWAVAHALSWVLVGALTLGLPIHAFLFRDVLERPLLGSISASLGALLGLGLWYLLTRTPGMLQPVHRIAALCLLGIALPQTVDDVTRTSACTGIAKPNLLLVTIDTCQTERLTPYGSVHDTTPYLNQLASQGLQFNRAYSPIALTGPAHATLFTGLHPLELGVTDNLRPIPSQPVTIAESLRAHGYRTLGVPGNTMVRARLNLHQGFDRFPQSAGERDWSALQWEYLFLWRTGRILFDRQLTFSRFRPDAAIQTNTALGLIPEAPRAQPWFCWVHYFDAHAPYERQPSANRTPQTSTDPTLLAQLCSHEGLYDLSYAGLAPLFGASELARRKITPWIATDAEIDDIRTIYDSQLEYIDQQLERLCETLRSRGQLENTVIVITADHGEALFEHGYFGHSYYPYEGEHRIPLIVWSPKRLQTGTRDGLVSLEDVAVAMQEFGIPSTPDMNRGDRGNPVGEALWGMGLAPEAQVPLLLLRGDHSRTLLTPAGQKLSYFATPKLSPYASHPWPGPEWQLVDGWLDTEETIDHRATPFPERGTQTNLLHLQQLLDEQVRGYEGVGPVDVNYAGHAGSANDDEALLQSLGYLQGASSADYPALAPEPRYTPAAEAARQAIPPAAASDQ